MRAMGTMILQRRMYRSFLLSESCGRRGFLLRISVQFCVSREQRRRRLGIEPMYLYAQKFGFGEYTGVEIEESKGTLAGRDIPHLDRTFPGSDQLLTFFISFPGKTYLMADRKSTRLNSSHSAKSRMPSSA